MIRIALVTGCALAAIGCFSPSLPAGISCAESGLCPLGQSCDPVDFICREPNPRADASLAFDANTNDAGCIGWPTEPLHFDSCAVGEPLPPIDFTQFLLGGAVYNTSTGILSAPFAGEMIELAPFVVPQTDGPDLAVLLFDSFEIPQGASLYVTGDRPLVIASNSTLSIEGSLFARGAVGDTGPGATTTDHCVVGDASAVSAGGGGGGLGTAGGGGAGAGAGLGGPALLPSQTVLAGCPGGFGRDQTNNTDSALSPGAGGGAIQLSARDSITVRQGGQMDAGGFGGDGGNNSRHGGFGGGSGGFIGLDAPQITVEGGAQLSANGGGGGEGGGGTNPGDDGDDATSPAVALGGSGGAGSGGDGGNGASGISAAASGVNNTSGGGGGGGVGFILYRGALDNPNALISPPATPFP